MEAGPQRVRAEETRNGRSNDPKKKSGKGANKAGKGRRKEKRRKRMTNTHTQPKRH